MTICPLQLYGCCFFWHQDTHQARLQTSVNSSLVHYDNQHNTNQDKKYDHNVDGFYPNGGIELIYEARGA